MGSPARGEGIKFPRKGGLCDEDFLPMPGLIPSPFRERGRERVITIEGSP